MPEVTCRKCLQPYPETEEHWYFQHGKRRENTCKKCVKARERNRYVKVATPLVLRPCCFCGKPFAPANKYANRREHCYQPVCVEKAHRKYDHRKIVTSREWKKRNKGRRHGFKKCPVCEKWRMNPQDHFSCRVCRKLAGDCSGNWVYVMPLEA